MGAIGQKEQRYQVIEDCSVGIAENHILEGIRSVIYDSVMSQIGNHHQLWDEILGDRIFKVSCR